MTIACLSGKGHGKKKSLNVDKCGTGGGGQSMWEIIKYCHIDLKSANMDREGGGVNRLFTNCRYKFFLALPSVLL